MSLLRTLVSLRTPSVPLPRLARGIASSPPVASGHSRWSKIRHKKGAADAQRSAHISKLMTAVYAALRPPGSTDPDLNPRLALALARAKEAGVPKSNIESAFARAAKIADGSGKQVVFEAMGPGGKVALMIECITENQSRTLSRVKELLHKRDARVANVSFLFERKGVLRVTPAEGSSATFDSYFEAALDGGAEDVQEVTTEDGVMWEATTAVADLGKLTTLITSPPHDAAYVLQTSELAFIPIEPVPIVPEGAEDGLPEDKLEGIARLVDTLEDEGDVVKVWTNLADTE